MYSSEERVRLGFRFLCSEGVPVISLFMCEDELKRRKTIELNNTEQIRFFQVEFQRPQN